ncbi:protein of unknown function [Methylorubrum extorquens DM4]|uniref:Uncharacterized protein n=1 Tax=Methylorubrum extorquens (strain DSM 6343 / CIP 106787 / DM4) TaxID=661410 RepID=C7CHF1_METED|nr:protein of unknown function [Methylorubrum extorquens DM4]
MEAVPPGCCFAIAAASDREWQAWLSPRFRPVDRPFIQHLQCGKDGIERDGLGPTPWQAAQGRAGLDRAGIGCPGRKDDALLGRGQARIGQHLARVPEDVTWGDDGVERVDGRRPERSVGHGAEALDGCLDLLHGTLLS